MNITTAALDEKLNVAAENAAQAVIAARSKYEEVALSFYEGTALSETLEKVGQVLVDAERCMASVAAARKCHEARLAEEAMEEAEMARIDFINERMRQIAPTPESWDETLEDLLDASKALLPPPVSLTAYGRLVNHIPRSSE